MNWPRPLEGFLGLIVALWLFEIIFQAGKSKKTIDVS